MKKTSYTTITGHHEHSDEFPKYCSVKHIYVRRWEASDASKVSFDAIEFKEIKKTFTRN